MKLTEDAIITPTLLRRFELEGEAEGGNGQHYALILRDNQRDVLCHHPRSPNLAPEQLLWAEGTLRMLNRELHHDGAWVIVFTHPKPSAAQCVLLASPTHCNYERWGLIWLDADADPQFTTDWAEGESEDLPDFADVMAAGPVPIVDNCETSWRLWQWQRQMLDLRPHHGETFKRARGERAPIAH